MKLGWLGRVLLVTSLSLAACSPVAPVVSPSPDSAARTPTPARSTATRTPSPSPTATPTPEPVSRLIVNPAAIQGRTLRFWHIWEGPAGAAMADLAAEFSAQNEWGLQVEPVYAGTLDELSAAVEAAYGNAEVPDLAVAYAYQAMGWGRGRAFTDLAPFAADPIWGLEPAGGDDFFPAAWAAGEIAGRRVGVPVYLNAQVLAYNRGWARELGFRTPPLTRAQFERQACAAVQANAGDDDPANDGTGGYLATTAYGAILNWIYATGEEVTTANGRSYRFDSEPVTETFQFLRDLFDRGCSFLAETQRPQDEFARRRALFFVDELTAIPELESAFLRTGQAEDWTLIFFPPETGESAWYVYGPQYVVLADNPEDQFASWLFLRWLLQPENQARLVRAAGTLPARTAALELLGDYAAEHPAWGQAAGWLPAARPAPPFESWVTVRWAVMDAATQLYRYYFEIDQVEQLSELLDLTADDLHRSIGR